MTDEEYMRIALDLAKRGEGWTNPNPMVGAVIVKDGMVIGSGWHKKYGEPHAERNALAACKESPKGATLYVTLEPCCHHGKQPPCTDAILESGIGRVVIGSADPNPLVCGKGVQILRAAGVEVTEGVLREECDELNRVFFHYINTKKPYVLLKYAMTVDGKTATKTGKSKWITGPEALDNVHRDRHRFQAIMVGVGTIIADDSRLTCRMPGGKNPIRIVCDSHLRTPFNSYLIKTAKEIPTIIATVMTDEEELAKFHAVGCETITVPEKDGHVDLNALMKALGERGIDSILLEGGARLAWSAMQNGIVNMVHAYIAPTIFGGAAARMPIEGAGVDDPMQGIRLTAPKVKVFGRDILLESEVLPCSPE